MTRVAMATNFFIDKMGYNSTCMGNIAEMLAPNRGFSSSAYWMICQHKFYHYRPPLPWQRNLRQKRL